MRGFSAVMLAVAAVCGHFAWGTPGVSAGGGGGGGGCRGSEVLDSATTSVEIRESCLYPVIARVAPGESVTWTNFDSVPHTVTGANTSWGNLEPVIAGASFRFDAAGVYPYYCAAHPWMAGAVVVGDGGSAGSPAQGKSAVAALRLELPRAPAPPAGESSGREGGRGYFALGAAVAGVLALAGGSAGFALGRRRA